MAKMTSTSNNGTGNQPIPNTEISPRDPKTESSRDSAIYISDSEESQSVQSRPTSFVGTRQRTASSASTSCPSRSDSTRTDRRLRRPAELNLSMQKKSDPNRTKSELELRYDMIRNSQTQSKAALKSPTQLLKDRLNLSPKKQTHDKVRTFTPPKPMLNGCILPGPAAQLDAFAGKDVRARTESGKAAWWCKFDKLVVFDGVEGSSSDSDEVKFVTRSSKGLSIARRRGDCETVIIPLDCTHCQEMLNRSEWKYDIQVCRRSVCWDCKERCRWEIENVQKQGSSTEVGAVLEREQNRERADSVLEDEEREREAELMRKGGIETVLSSINPISVM